MAALDDIDMHGRKQRQQAILRAGRDLAALHRFDQILDQRGEDCGIYAHAGVTLLHGVAGIPTWSAADGAESLDELGPKANTIGFGEEMLDAAVIGQGAQELVNKRYNTRFPTQIVAEFPSRQHICRR